MSAQRVGVMHRPIGHCCKLLMCCILGVVRWRAHMLVAISRPQRSKIQHNCPYGSYVKYRTTSATSDCGVCGLDVCVCVRVFIFCTHARARKMFTLHIYDYYESERLPLCGCRLRIECKPPASYDVGGALTLRLSAEPDADRATPSAASMAVGMCSAERELRRSVAYRMAAEQPLGQRRVKSVSSAAFEPSSAPAAPSH